jgi:S-formylglutathione hydrolase FrmB
MLNIDPWQPNLARRLEQLYAAGMPHAIVVLPDCFTTLGGSQYINSDAVGRYEDYVVEEIVSFVDREYRTIPGPEGRAVFGKSSGGYGAMVLGMRHPDVFGALACHSGDMWFELCYKPDFPKACNALNAAGGLEAWWEAFKGRVKKTNSDFDVLNLLAMSACYSPGSDGFMGIDLPVDPYTCKLKEDVWRRWLDHDPVMMAPRHAANLRRLRLVYMDCGTRDEFNLHFGARILSQTLAALDVPHVHEEFDDTHMSIQYRYSVSLPKLLDALQGSGIGDQGSGVGADRSLIPDPRSPIPTLEA